MEGFFFSKYTVGQFDRIRAERDAVAQTNAIVAFPFLRLLNLPISFWRSVSELAGISHSKSPILKGKVVDILTELGHTSNAHGDEQIALVELTRTLGYGPELKETGDMNIYEATSIIERYRTIVTDLVGESSTIADIEQGQDVQLKEKTGKLEKNYMVISFDVGSSEVKVHGMTCHQSGAELLYQVVLKGPESKSLVNLVEFTGDFADVSGGSTLFWDVCTDKNANVRVLESNNE